MLVVASIDTDSHSLQMAFQTVPPQSDLQASIPAGRAAVTIRPYTKPTPAFGPGSAEYVRQQAEELEQLAREDEPPAITAQSPTGGYAGAGAYF